MTTIRLIRATGGWTGFEAYGHAGNTPEGENIVCAAISAAVALTECQLTDILHLQAEVTVEEDDARIRVQLPAPISEAQAPLAALALYLKSLAQDYPHLIKIREVHHDKD